MTGERSDFLHGWVAPNIYLILAVAMSGNELVDIFSEHKIAYLASGFYRLDVLELNSIPELDSSILSSTASCKQSLLVG